MGSFLNKENVLVESRYGTEGFTWRSAMAILYSAIVFMPAVLFMNLSAGSVILSTYTVLLLFVELARYFGKPLSVQEAVVIFMCSGVASGDTLALGLIYGTYVRSAPISALFMEPGTGIPFPLAIPNWYTPPLTSAVYLLRTFFHPDWAVPICVAILGTLLVRIVDISLGFLAYKLYVETIRLPFPLQGVDASLVETVVGRPADRMRVLIISAVIGIGWGLLAYGAPLASAGAIQLLPLPFASLNRFMERIFPGSSFGISIDLMAHCVGLLLPFWTSISIFLGSLSFYTIGNGILVSLYPEKPAGIFGWTPGMDIMQCYQWSNLYIWSSVTIGLGLAAGLVPLLKNIKVLLRAFSRTPIGRSEVKVLSPVPIWIPIATWAAASIISVVLTAMLVPGFPVWILVLLSFGWTPISVLIVGRMLGETSLAPTGGVGGGSLFYVREAAFIGSGYQHIDIWYAPLVVSYGGGHGILAQFKVCELTGTKLMSIVKGLFFAYPIAWLMSFLLVQLFWLIAPIPSAAYPMAMATWPFSVTMSNIMVSGFRSFFRPELATTALVIGVGLQLAIDFFHLPFSLIGFLVGAVTMVPFGLAYLIGGIAGKIMAWRIGNEKWNDYKVVIVAGIILGGSIVASTAAAIGLISKAKWVLPY